MAKKRRTPTTRQPPQAAKLRHSSASGGAGAASKKPRPRRDPFGRPWTPLAAEAADLGVDLRTLRKHLDTQLHTRPDLAFVRELNGRWYVRHTEFRAWWDEQRPRRAASAR